jgi:ankyrin repeat protein
MPSNGTILRLACVAAMMLGRAARAHETDQFTLPAGREFAELGPHLNNWAYQAIERGVKKVNERIERALQEKRGQRSMAQLQHADELVKAVNGEFPDAYSLIEGMETLLHSREMKQKYPGLVVGYEKQFGNIYQHVHFPLDPRQFFRIWHASTFKAYGSYMGTDKIGHFVDMGMHYYREYSAAKRKGLSDVEADRKAVEVGTHGPLFSERGMVGYLSAGAYSNADLAANYVGLLFYQNLTKPVMLKGKTQPPMVVRKGEYWAIAPHVRADSGFFRWFMSDHFNEVLNPSHFEPSMRDEIRKAIKSRTELVLARYADEHGNRRPREYFENMLKEMRTYYGQDYGYRGPSREMITVGNTCFEPFAPDADPTSRDFTGHTPLHAAASRGDLEAIKRLLANGADVNATVRSSEGYSSEWGNTPLHLAARDGRVEAAELLLDAYANVNAKNHRGQTPLHRAVGHPSLARLLIENLANVDAADNLGQTALHWAAQDGRVETVELLLSKGSRTYLRDNCGQTPLHLAARSSRGAAGGLAAAELLVNRGADVNARDMLNVTPAHLAAATGNAPLLDLLMSKGCDLELKDDFGRTAHDAARRAPTETASALIEPALNIDVATGDHSREQPAE